MKKFFVMVGICLSLGTSALAMKEMSKEDRAKMAAAHEAMATCLKSDKTQKECRKDMHASMKEFRGKMGGKGKMGKKGMSCENCDHDDMGDHGGHDH